MLGDSLSARGDWEVLLYPNKILNLGHDGDSTRDLLNRLELPMDVHAKRIYLMIGINDMNKYLTLNDIFKNYIEILNRLQKSDSKIIVQSTLFTQMKTFNPKVKILNERIKNYCNENDISFLDLNNELSNDEVLKEEYTTDGLHLNTKGYLVWARKIRESFLDF